MWKRITQASDKWGGEWIASNQYEQSCRRFAVHWTGELFALRNEARSYALVHLLFAFRFSARGCFLNNNFCGF